jgi:hypothetical protein
MLLIASRNRFHDLIIAVVEMRQCSREETESGDDQVKVSANASKGIWGDHTNDEIEDPVACRLS